MTETNLFHLGSPAKDNQAVPSRRVKIRTRVLAASIGGLAIAVACVAGFLASRTILAKPSSIERSPIVSKPSEPEKTAVDPKDAEYKQRLTPEQYHVTREKGTERAFTGRYWDHKGVGVYKCVCCGSPLFDSKAKYESGTGWPSFYQPIKDQNIEIAMDFSLFQARTEVLCKTCHAHLGHVFDDGPKPTGLRYCINSAALDFQETEPKREP